MYAIQTCYIKYLTAQTYQFINSQGWHMAYEQQTVSNMQYIKLYDYNNYDWFVKKNGNFIAQLTLCLTLVLASNTLNHLPSKTVQCVLVYQNYIY